MPPDDKLETLPDEEIPEVEAQADEDEDSAGEPEQEADDGQSEEERGGTDEGHVKPSRAETRFQKLSNTAKEATERASAAERRAQDLETRLSRLEKPEQVKEPTADEMALWSPEQVIDYKLGKATSRFEQTLGQMQFQQYEMGDKTSFKALCASDATAAKYADEVEMRLTELRAKGQNVDRERLLTYLVGEKVRQGGRKAKEKQAGEGERRIARQTVRPGSAKGDTETPRRDSLSEAEAREKRLEGQTF